MWRILPSGAGAESLESVEVGYGGGSHLYHQSLEGIDGTGGKLEPGAHVAGFPGVLEFGSNPCLRSGTGAVGGHNEVQI